MTTPPPAPPFPPRTPAGAAWLMFAWLVFFGWNLWFCALAWFGFGPFVFLPLGVATATGMIPWHVGVFAALGLALPVAFLLGGGWRLHADAGRLLSLFYGVEAPLLVLVAVRLFAIGQLSAPTLLLLAAGTLAALGLLRTLLSGPTERSAVGQGLRQAAAACGLVLGLGGVALTAVYAVPIGALALHLLVSELPFTLLRTDPTNVWPTLLGLSFAGFFFATAGVVAIWPVVAFGLALRQMQLVGRASAARFGPGPAAGLAAGVSAAVVGGLLLASRQPQAAAFAQLDAVDTDAERRGALADGPALRAALVDTALAGHRLLDADPEGEHVLDLWREAGLGALGPAAQGAWQALLHPFRYHPVLRRDGGRFDDAAEARVRYADVFDAPIEVVERDAFLAAAAATWSAEQAHAGLLDAGDDEVRLAAQEITIAPDGDVATVRIHDEYRNRTFVDAEVLIAFSLPETAAVTGLWLSLDDDFASADRFVVAPRGAAQEVYEASVARRTDPALLEEVGPGAYRLRAFPVPGRAGRASDPFTVAAEGAPLHLWLELTVPVDTLEAPCWPMPRVAETRNLGIDPDRRTLDGAPFSADGWAPACVPAPGSGRRGHAARVGDLVVSAVPAGPVAARSLGRVAVVVDGTASMGDRRQAVDAALAQLRAASDAVAPWCVVEDALRPCPDFEADGALFYGARPLAERLAGFDPGPADRVVVLTDGVANPRPAPPGAPAPLALPAPTWLVHLGGLPAAWPDTLLDAVRRSGGGAVADVDALVLQVADPAVRDGWRWELRAALPGDAGEEGPFRKLAARRGILGGDAVGADLDALHAIARADGVVTPYSSMLVLVNDAQRRQLADAEARGDRFDREEIDVPEAPADLSAVPEPETWVLGGLSLAAAALAGRRRRG